MIGLEGRGFDVPRHDNAAIRYFAVGLKLTGVGFWRGTISLINNLLTWLWSILELGRKRRGSVKGRRDQALKYVVEL